MVTTKKQPWNFFYFLVVASAGFWSGCGDPGPRALLDGERLIVAGKYDKAVSRLTEAVDRLPQNAQAWNHFGLAHHHLQQYPKAINAYQQALRLDRNLAAARYNLGCLYLEQTNFSAAAAELTTYVTLAPSNINGWLKLGTAQLRQAMHTAPADKGKWLDAAKKNFERSNTMALTAEAYNALGIIEAQRGRARDSTSLFQRALQKQPNYPPALLNLAILYHHYLNDRRAALQKYREYLVTQPRVSRFKEIEEIARQLDSELNASATPAANPVAQSPPPPSVTKPEPSPPKLPPPKATETVQTKPPVAPSASPPTPAPRVTPPVEVAKLPEEQPVQAARDVPAPSTASQKTSPASVTETTVPAETVSAQKSPEPKKGFFKRMNPVEWFRGKTNSNSNTPSPPDQSVSNSTEKNSEPVQNTKSTVQQTEKPAQPTAASAPRASANSAIRPPAPKVARYKYLSPQKPSPGKRTEALQRFNAGVEAQNQGDLRKAMESFQQAIKIDPSFYEAYFTLGLVAYESGDYSTCLNAYEHALAISPESASARYNFALGLQKSNYPQDAANELEKILAKDPKEARAHFVLANIYDQSLLRKDLARQHYSKVLELDPDHSEALAIRYWLAQNP